MRRSPVLLLAALLAAALLLAGCSGGGVDSDTSSQAAPAQDGGSGGGGSGDAAAGGSGGEAAGGAGSDGAESDATGGQTPAAPGRVVSGRVVTQGDRVIRTGELTVRVEDVRTAAEEAARLAAAAGGLVESEERSGAGEDGSAVVRLRVPPTQFDATVARLAELGDELDRRRGTVDVDDQMIDLESRLATQRASVLRVRALLDEAEALADVVQIEGELTRRTADLESLQARLAAVRDQVQLSTITVRLVGDGAAAAATGPRGFSDGLAAGWAALVAVTRAVGVTAGALLPFSPVLLAVAALVWRSRRRTPGPVGA